MVSDLLRPDGNCQPGGKDRATTWLWNALKQSVHRACGLPVARLTVAQSPRLHDWIASQRPLHRADAHWATQFQQVPWSEQLDQLVLQPLRGRFCIGFEMPPWLIRQLDLHGIPYLDLHIHPVRFLDDLLFAGRACLPGTQAALLSMAVQESEVLTIAGLREAMCRFISEANLPDNTLLVVGQRRYDATQVEDGGFFDAASRADAIHALCAAHAAVILKPHPFDARHSLLEVAAAAPGGVAGVFDDNIYRLMSMPQVSAVLTVNSSVAHEAGYFGKRVHTLAPLPIHTAWRGAEPDGSSYASLNDVVLTPDFWRTVLGQHTRVTPMDGMRLPPKANRLRIAFDSFWNFQQIDTDRIPAPPAQA